MAFKEMTVEKWAELLWATPDGRERFNGCSPGPVATELGISRQALHKAIKANRLNAIRIVDSRGRHTATIIPEAEFRAFRESRKTG